MNFLIAAALVGAAVLFARRARASRTVLVPPAQGSRLNAQRMPCPTVEDVERHAREEGGTVVIVDRASDVPGPDAASRVLAELARGLGTTPGALAGQLAYYSRADCRFYVYEGGSFVPYDRAYDFFYTWKYGAGWQERAARGEIG